MMSSGTFYLLEIDISEMSRDEFLECSDYQNNAQIVLVPVGCDGVYTAILIMKRFLKEIMFLAIFKTCFKYVQVSGLECAERRNNAVALMAGNRYTVKKSLYVIQN